MIYFNNSFFLKKIFSCFVIVQPSYNISSNIFYNGRQFKKHVLKGGGDVA